MKIKKSIISILNSLLVITMILWALNDNYLSIEITNKPLKITSIIAINIYIIYLLTLRFRSEKSTSKLAAFYRFMTSILFLIMAIIIFAYSLSSLIRASFNSNTEVLVYTDPKTPNHKVVYIYEDHGAFGGIGYWIEYYEIIFGQIRITTQRVNDGVENFKFNGKLLSELLKE